MKQTIIEKEEKKLFEKFPRLATTGNRPSYFFLYYGGATLNGNFGLEELIAIVESLKKISEEVNK